MVTDYQCMSGWAMSLASCVVRRLKAELAKVGAAARQADEAASRHHITL